MTAFHAVLIVLAHFLGDWLWQSRDMALRKSSEIKVLIEHVSRVGLILTVPAYIIFDSFVPLVIWITINLVLHAIQDWFIWKIAAKVFLKSCKTKEEAYNKQAFWNIVGLDQFLHYFVYFTTLIALT